MPKGTPTGLKRAPHPHVLETLATSDFRPENKSQVHAVSGDQTWHPAGSKNPKRTHRGSKEPVLRIMWGRIGLEIWHIAKNTKQDPGNVKIQRKRLHPFRPPIIIMCRVSPFLVPICLLSHC